MAKLVDKNFVYECEICKKRYNHIVQNIAKGAAEECEKRGTPLTHRYKVGDFVTARNIGNFFAGAKKIIDLVFDERTHKPAYYVQVDRDSSRSIYMLEGDIDSLCPRQTIDVYRY